MPTWLAARYCGFCTTQGLHAAYEMTAKALRPGIWALKDGGGFLRTRLLDPRSGKFVEYQRVFRNVTLNQAERERYRLRCDARDLANGRKQAPPLWSVYAASLFESKVNEGKIPSAKGREKWPATIPRSAARLRGIA